MAHDYTSKGFATRAIHAGQPPDPSTGATVTPISVSSTFTQAAPGDHKGFEYARSGNPTRKALEECLAAIEGGERGLAFASGLAATTAVFQALLKPGDELLAAADLYGGTFRLLDKVYKPWGLNPVYSEDPSPEGFRKLLTSKTKLVWIETPTNPMLQVLDIAAIAEVAHANGSLLAVDNTFASPYLQQPLKLGADIVVHSTTKYLGGHSDVVGGAVIGRESEMQQIKFFQNAMGGVPGPFDCYLTLRGIKTLAVRMDRHCASAMVLAEWLRKQSAVSEMHFPGFPDHPGHKIAAKQMKAFGGMISLKLKGGAEAAKKFLSKTHLFSLAESLGGVESLVNHPATMTHASIPKAVREARGVDDALIRLSVGIEEVEDLREDLAQAMQ